ncbi:MAG: DGC domain protein [Methanomassiliicoccales archaeon PtaU1.Bin124]|nr:MAG: DGC domain protein [Methanomassiliicoccales archaeon PtaU1.Bin124]
MSRVDIIMCAGFSPSARMVRKALRRVAEKRDIRVLSPCGAGSGLAKYQEELRTIDPAKALVVEGCDGCCAMQGLMMQGIGAPKLLIMDKIILVDEKAIAAAEQKILQALEGL